jgi:ABC-type branched-subunit amino acid transport system substrate-binding protein
MMRRVDRAKLAGVVMALLCGSGLVACGGSASAGGGSKGPVTLALVSFKVPGSDLLTGYTAGAQAAVNQINAEGGFGGRKLQLVTCNSMMQAAATTACAHRTIADHPVAMFGCEPTWSQAGLPVYSAAKVSSLGCMTAPADFTSPLSFGLVSGGQGLGGSMAGFLCHAMPNVRRTVLFTVDLPLYAAIAKTMAAELKACGKTMGRAVYPATATDVTPYVAKVAEQKPGFVMLMPLAGAGAISIYQDLEQDGIPASHVIVVESNLDHQTLAQAGSAMDGTYGVEQFGSWGDAANPDVEQYLRATKRSRVDPRSGNVATGYASVMFFYAAAKRIGFSTFDAASLTRFMDDKHNAGFHIPMSRSLVIPGPTGYPQVRQPYSEIVQWTHGNLNVVKHGTDDGWVNGY